MAEKMTLEKIVERMEKALGYSPEREKWIAGLRAHPAQPAQAVDVDDLAQEIRRVDGNHSLGAGALAEALMPFITRALGNANGKEG